MTEDTLFAMASSPTLAALHASYASAWREEGCRDGLVDEYLRLKAAFSGAGMAQLTEDWFEARRGKVTSSRISDVLAGGKGITRTKYLEQLAIERLTGKTHNTFQNPYMTNGIEQEPIARSIYEATHDLVIEIGFCDHPTIPMTGASTDGLVGADGIIEIKTREPHIQIEFALSRKIDTAAFCQIQWGLECSAREWCDYISWSPECPENLRMIVMRVDRDDAWLEATREKVQKFLSEVDELVEKLKAL